MQHGPSFPGHEAPSGLPQHGWTPPPVTPSWEPVPHAEATPLTTAGSPQDTWPPAHGTPASHALSHTAAWGAPAPQAPSHAYGPAASPAWPSAAPAQNALAYAPPVPHPQAYPGPEWPSGAYGVPPAHGPQHGYPAPGPVAPQAPPGKLERWLVPTGRSWQAVVASWVGLLSVLLWVLGPIAAGFGVWALVRSARDGSMGRPRAIFAVVVGTLVTIRLVKLVLP